MRIHPQSARDGISPACLNEPAAEGAAIAAVPPIVCCQSGEPGGSLPTREEMAGIPSQVARGSLGKESEWKTVSALPVVAVEWRFTNGSRVLRMRTYRQKADAGLRIDTYQCKLKRAPPAQPTVNRLSTTGTRGKSSTALAARMSRCRVVSLRDLRSPPSKYTSAFRHSLG